ncbi:MAG: DUF4011 domain-containing protein [Isosphaeraceae bacterium]|nr:DUF4011 domain-containing protein [Isosphaeraceae bacterium]
MTTSLNDCIEKWRCQLLDTTKRNRLISLNLGRAGTVKLTHPGAERLWSRLVVEEQAMSFPFKRDLVGKLLDEEDDGPSGEPGFLLFDAEADSTVPGEFIDLQLCLKSPHLRDDHILTDLTDKQLDARLGRLALNATTSMTEQGVPTLYLAFGLLKWFESLDSELDLFAPLLLFPVAMERENIAAPWKVKLQDEEAVPNHSLIQLMSQQFKIRFPEPPDDKGKGGDSSWRTRYFDDVRMVIHHQKRWEILDECVLGTFGFQKFAIWKDLGENRDQILAHDLCRVIAGDSSIRLSVPKNLPRADKLDAETRPATTYHILDADSSQHEAIEVAKRGVSLVLDGPPGTGKSQTIANIIAEFLAMGKTVLFVSEKAAALEVVKRRLDAQGLGDFCLECHSHKANKKQVIDELRRCLSLSAADPHQDHAKDLDRLFEARAALNAYVRALHAERPPLGLSTFQAHGRLAAVIHMTGASNCTIPDVPGMTPDRLRRLEELLDSLTDCRGVIRDYATHPWRGIRRRGHTLILVADIQHHFERLARGLSQIRDAAPMLVDLGFAPAEPSLTHWQNVLELVKGIPNYKDTSDDKDTPNYPLVPADWFQGRTRQVIEGYIRLDEVTRAYRRARAAAPEFSEEAVQRLDAGAQARLDQAMGAGDSGLRPHEHTTVLTLRSHLQGIVPALRSLIERTRAMDKALSRVLGVLDLRPRPLPVHEIEKVHQLLGSIGKITPLHRSWLDVPKRQVIQKAIDKGREAEALNDEVRLRLLDRLLPSAFGPELANLARRLHAYRAGWKRLLPGWWRLRSRLASLYDMKEVPETRQLWSDLRELSEYHDRLDYVREVKRRYADQLVLHDDGEVDWEQTAEELKKCEPFDSPLRVFPELKDLLVDPVRVDQDALNGSLSALAESYRTFRDAVEPISRHIDLRCLLGSEGKPSRMSVTDFSEWLGKRLRGLEAQLSALEWVAELIQPAHDVAIADLPARLRALEALRQHGAEVDRLAATLGLASTGHEVHDRDWSQRRLEAEWTIRFLDQHADRPPEPLIRAVTRPEIHAALPEAVRRNRAACSAEFRESWAFLMGLFEPDQEVSTGIRIGHAPIPAILEWVEARRKDVNRVQEWMKFHEIRESIDQAGLGPILSELLDGKLAVEDAKGTLLARFYRSWLDWVYEQEPILRQFATEAQERQIDEFCKLDRDAIRWSSTRIREAQLNDPDRPRAATLEAPVPHELATLLREANKKKRHLPLRLLFARTPTVLLRLKPCPMMSPLAVSTYLNTREPLIAFSNRYFYGNELITFPGVLDTGEEPAVRFEYLPEGRWKSGAPAGVSIRSRPARPPSS